MIACPRCQHQNPADAASYFTSGAFFDACAGAADETIGTCIIEVGAAFGRAGELLRPFG